MKKNIFMYLFVFSALLALFIYVNSKRVNEHLNSKLDKQQALIEKYNDSLKYLEKQVFKANHFSFDYNEDAISYFERSNLSPKEVDFIVKDQLQELNFYKGEEHPLIPYVSTSDDRKMLTNTVKLLNHRWLIADFSDGEFWGEIFVRYFINDDKTVDFELADSFLYPLQ